MNKKIASVIMTTILGFGFTAHAQINCQQGAAVCGNPEFDLCTIDVNGFNREFCLHVPRQPTTDVPLIIGLHGNRGEGADVVAWLENETESGAILAAPTAILSSNNKGCTRSWRTLGDANPTWANLVNDDTCTATSTGAFLKGHADLDFIGELLAELDAAHDIEGRYIFGFSNGAGMVSQIMITAPLSSSFDGYGMVALGFNTYRLEQVALGGTVANYSADSNTKRPTMLIWSHNDRTAVDVQAMID